VKAKLPRVDKKVIVQERFTSPWNIAVWVYLLGRQVLVRSSNRVSNTLFTFVNDSLALWRLD
jgi:hypothetical protein